MTGPRPPEPTREILNIEEASHLLGVSTKTFAKVLRQGQLPGRKVGREWKFSRQALIDWVASGRSRDFLDVEDTLDAPGNGAPSAQNVGKGAHGAPTARPLQRPAPRTRPDREVSVEED